MNENLDEWLTSLGINEDSQSSASMSVVPQENTPTPELAEETSTTSFSMEDFNDVLAENGFQQPSFDEAEEIDEGDSTQVEYRIDSVESAEATARIETDGSLSLLSEQSAQQDEEEVEVAPTENTSMEPLLHPNSPSILIDSATSRFSGAEWYDEIQKQRIIVAGIGGIGSNCVYQLARMNPEALVMYDDDVVERANMSGQLFGYNDIGKAKVDAMMDMIIKYTTMRNIFAINDKFTINSEAGDVMICGFDNMNARKTFFDAWHNHMLHYSTTEERSRCLFIDGRLSIDVLQVFCVTGDNEYACDEYYTKYLFSDEEAEVTQCSLKQTTYLACMIGSFIVNLFTNWVANLLNPAIPYDLPFFIEYDAQNMIFKTIK